MAKNEAPRRSGTHHRTSEAGTPAGAQSVAGCCRKRGKRSDGGRCDQLPEAAEGHPTSLLARNLRRPEPAHVHIGLHRIAAVRTSAKRLRTPNILPAGEFPALLLELAQRERVMVLLAGSTGLRRGELIVLRWRDVDVEAKQANIAHSAWHNVEGNTKTEASWKPVPLPSLVIDELKQWKPTSLYRTDEEYISPSIAKNGSQYHGQVIDPPVATTG